MLRLVMVVSFILTTMAMSCEDARTKCAFRTGCGNALQSYIIGCSAILNEKPLYHCPEECQNALVALTSTDEGKDLMTCECSDNFCNETKQRIEICRPQVMKAVKNDTIVSCDVAQWICAGDASCAKALEYYHRYCQQMFAGQRCTFRCRNSIAILKKQEKAAKLDSCWCSGREEVDCVSIRTNMAKLCFNKTSVEVTRVTDPDFDLNNDLAKTTPVPADGVDKNTIDGATATDGASSMASMLGCILLLVLVSLHPHMVALQS